MKEKIHNSTINEKIVTEVLRFLFSLSLLPFTPTISEIRQFICSRLNLSFEDFSKIEKFLIRKGFVLRYGGRKLLLTPKGVMYVLYSEKHE